MFTCLPFVVFTRLPLVYCHCFVARSRKCCHRMLVAVSLQVKEKEGAKLVDVAGEWDKGGQANAAALLPAADKKQKWGQA